MTRYDVGFIGLGNMGLPMTSRLIDAGFSVAGFDISAESRGVLESRGGVAVDIPDALVDSRALILMLPSSNVVETVLVEKGLLDLLPSGSLVIDMSSSEPLRTEKLAALAASRDVTLLDAPVSGGVAGAREGKLTIMIGGPDEQVERAREFLKPLGTATHTGAVGSGHALKALNNLLNAVHLYASSEALNAGIAYGLDPEIMLQVINTSSGRSGSTQTKWPNFVLPGTFDSGFAAALLVKDMRIAAGLMHQLDMPSAMADDAVGLWSAALTDMHDGSDHTEIARWLANRPHPADSGAE